MQTLLGTPLNETTNGLIVADARFVTAVAITASGSVYVIVRRSVRSIPTTTVTRYSNGAVQPVTDAIVCFDDLDRLVVTAVYTDRLIFQSTPIVTLDIVEN